MSTRAGSNQPGNIGAWRRIETAGRSKKAFEQRATNRRVDYADYQRWMRRWGGIPRQVQLAHYIERAEGVSVDLCAEASRHVSDLLDVEEIMPEAYTLEVSSPGMDRLLFKPDQYLAHVGEKLDVRLSYPYEGRKKIVGLLAGIEDDSVILQLDSDEYLLPLENVQKARIVPVFD